MVTVWLEAAVVGGVWDGSVGEAEAAMVVGGGSVGGAEVAVIGGPGVVVVEVVGAADIGAEVRGTAAIGAEGGEPGVDVAEGMVLNWRWLGFVMVTGLRQLKVERQRLEQLRNLLAVLEEVSTHVPCVVGPSTAPRRRRSTCRRMRSGDATQVLKDVNMEEIYEQKFYDENLDDVTLSRVAEDDSLKDELKVVVSSTGHLIEAIGGHW
ncbi:unnamed protein product [Allacma fusca]|uniref:Uncharacterized protein n=1 Tax=Allacma fusca TaxID=39272 RepID=A0A8J2NRJ9_9HEXA|nr:unnamed protein product [Allacma fusca]